LEDRRSLRCWRCPQLLKKGWPDRDCARMVNFPASPRRCDRCSYLPCPEAASIGGINIESRRDTRDIPYYWLGFSTADRAHSSAWIRCGRAACRAHQHSPLRIRARYCQLAGVINQEDVRAVWACAYQSDDEIGGGRQESKSMIIKSQRKLSSFKLQANPARRSRLTNWNLILIMQLQACRLNAAKQGEQHATISRQGCTHLSGAGSW